MTLNTDWRAVTDKYGRKHLEASGQNDFNLGLLLTVLEVPVIHSETVGELYFRLNLLNHLTKGNSLIKFERFMGSNVTQDLQPEPSGLIEYSRLTHPSL